MTAPAIGSVDRETRTAILGLQRRLRAIEGVFSGGNGVSVIDGGGPSTSGSTVVDGGTV